MGVRKGKVGNRREDTGGCQKNGALKITEYLKKKGKGVPNAYI